MKKFLLIPFLSAWIWAPPFAWAQIEFHAVHHATLVIQTASQSIYVDPVEAAEAYSSFPQPDIILITHGHRDHLNKTVVNAIKQPGTLIIGSREVVQMLSEGKVLNNGDSLEHGGILIEAVPAYNLTPGRLKFHPRGQGNGYVITADKKRIYISGDTEDIQEMRTLKDIDYAFVCMNLPYTMTVDQAVSAVMAFKPRLVMPYHYRGQNGKSDIDRFKQAVEKDTDTKVEFLNWY